MPRAYLQAEGTSCSRWGETERWSGGRSMWWWRRGMELEMEDWRRTKLNIKEKHREGRWNKNNRWSERGRRLEKWVKKARRNEGKKMRRTGDCSANRSWVENLSPTQSGGGRFPLEKMWWVYGLDCQKSPIDAPLTQQFRWGTVGTQPPPH